MLDYGPLKSGFIINNDVETIRSEELVMAIGNDDDISLSFAAAVMLVAWALFAVVIRAELKFTIFVLQRTEEAFGTIGFRVDNRT